ncbi:hypothetical protein [Antribacter gilvus]|uniref:hypothetical protein n=1 Tax=Antribacter gilvus TaxID=2304675 RepID=UPI000F7B27D4|nr:hypothetical protein [Antribacter gilvus]
MAALTAVTVLAPMVGATAQANETPLWQTEIAQIPSTEYSRDALHYVTEATEALRPWVGQDGLDVSRLEPVLADVGTRYYDGARFASRADADAAFDNLTHFESFLKSRMTGASPPDGDAEVGHVTALVSSMTGVRLLADAAIQDADATIGPFRSPDLPADIEVPAGMDQAFALLDSAEADLAKADEMFLKANITPATINSERAWSNGFAVLETFGITYDGDHDQDGLKDVLELMFGSSPLLSDSDFDGLTDSFEITELIGWTWPGNPDSDADGLGDGAEDVDGDGLTNLQEQELGTSPTNPDTDGDRVSDGDEVAAGTNPLVPDQPDPEPVPPTNLPPIETQPTEADTDGDGLTDTDESDDIGSDPADPDSDGDGLSDSEEVNLDISPLSTDTDGDGLSDGYEVQNAAAEGIDPAVFDERLSKWDYISDFLLGMFAGEFSPRDSLAWLAGNLCSGALSFIPVVGWIVGGIADIRDTLGAAIHGDWVGAGLSVTGVVPYAGDAVAIVGKILKWVNRTFSTTAIRPSRFTEGVSDFMRRDDVPRFLKVEILESMLGDAWTPLMRWAGDDVDAARAEDLLLLLSRSRNLDLQKLGSQLNHSLSRPGASAPWMRADPVPGGRDIPANKVGEVWVASEISTRTGRQVTIDPATNTIKASDGSERIVDGLEHLGDGRVVAHETKTGLTNPDWTSHILGQCQKDAQLRREGKIVDAIWHFVGNNRALGDSDDLLGRSIGIRDEVFDCLTANGIAFIIHRPSGDVLP